MTITEVRESSSKGNEFVAASCTRCFRRQKMIFHIRIDNPTDEQRNEVQFQALRHDRTGTHPVTVINNYRTR